MRQKREKESQGAGWRRLDNTAKLLAAVSGEDLSNVFRISFVLKSQVRPELLELAMLDALEEFPMFRVRLRRGFFWSYFETNNREPIIEEENAFPCRFIDPHDSSHYLFRVSYYKKRLNLEMFHALTDGMGAIQFSKWMTERYLELEEQALERERREKPRHEEGQERDCQEKRRESNWPEGGRQGEESQGLNQPEEDRQENRQSESGRRENERPEDECRENERQKEERQEEERQEEERQEGERQEEERLENERKKNGIRGRRQADGYLKHYKKQASRRYGTERAMSLKGERLPFDSQNIVHGYLNLSQMKALAREEDVSITRYLAAALIWSLIEVYGEEEELKLPPSLNLPINLRNFFDSETLANFFAVTNISWPDKKRPESFRDVLCQVGRQMDEKIVKSRLEEMISYNVSNEKKWYVRIVPLFIKKIVMNQIFIKSSRAYTMTFSNLGLLKLDLKWEEKVEQIPIFIGVSRRQPLKCTTVAFQDRLCVTFDSILNDTKLSDYFFTFLEDKGVSIERESNGAVDHNNDQGTYPQVSYDKKTAKRLAGIFYLVLLTAAVVTGAVSLATYGAGERWWAVIAVGGMLYAALTVRYSLMRRSNLAGILLSQSLGADLLLVLIDSLMGFQGWSFNYAIPSLILFDVIAIIFLMVVNRLNWQSYFMYQISITIFSFIPLILWAVGLTTRPLMAIITTVASVVVLIVTILMGDRSVKKELKRRFHF